MAGGPYKRTNAWQIKWRQGDAWQSESFALEHDAHYFKYLVEQAGNRWPTGWIKGHGFVTEDDVRHLLCVRALGTSAKRTPPGDMPQKERP